MIPVNMSSAPTTATWLRGRASASARATRHSRVSLCRESGPLSITVAMPWSTAWRIGWYSWRAWPHPRLRGWIFTCGVPDGWGGGAGKSIRVRGNYEFGWPPQPGGERQPRETADQVLSERRREAAERVLAAAGDHAAS